MDRLARGRENSGAFGENLCALFGAESAEAKAGAIQLAQTLALVRQALEAPKRRGR